MGPGPIEPHIEHARGFVAAWHQHSPDEPSRFLDLGSGGGLPGFLLLTEWQTPGVLLESRVRRTAYLEEALLWPDAPTNGSVVTARAEDVSRWAGFEEDFELITARAFGPPSVTAECSVRLLKIGGLLIISEPPLSNESGGRWPEEGLAELGLRPLGIFRTSSGYQIVQKVSPTPEKFPRRSGVPTKKPLF